MSIFLHLQRFSQLPGLLALIALLLSTGCTNLHKQTEAPADTSPLLPFTTISALESPATEQVHRQWQVFCFRMPFNAETGPRWSLDTLLADSIIAPAIYQQGNALPLWRIHRRAADDSAGHQVRFIAYADEITLKQIESTLLDNPLLSELMSAGYVDRVIASCGPKDTAAELEATSDPNWSIDMQRAWPYFAMGVSATWLKLIEQKRNTYETEPATLDELITRYDEIHESVTLTWEKEGQHAFLHHLNALFGYQPLFVQKYLRF
ncbi:MAG: hypothetical protein H7A01_13200 [Hahellaceae bacterium]|nr:hypothetical protein [Hahellaceae bacterium]MCP5209723.1 hypothetical protein [Hahellaceae bacterium]